MSKKVVTLESRLLFLPIMLCLFSFRFLEKKDFIIMAFCVIPLKLKEQQHPAM